MFGISGFELIIILVFVLVIFGPDKLPELGRTVGRAMATFKRAQQDMEHVIRAEVYSSEKRTAATKPAGAAADDESATPAATPTPSKAEEIWSVTDEADDEEDEE